MIHGAGGIILRDGRFLLLRGTFKGRVYWEFPKGQAEADENLYETALREVAEETGLLDLELLSDLTVRETYRGVGDKKTVTYWLFATESEPRLSWEHNGYRWCTFNEARQLLSKRRVVLLEQAYRLLLEAELL